MSLDPLFLQLQEVVAGRFSLEREIGRGGMGVVYLARDVALERPVAIKVLAPSLATSATMRERFLREARTAAQCFHPHIVPIHAVESSGDLAWIVMSYVRGETLADRLRREGPLPPQEVRRLGREIGWALSYAHQRGVVHRDIKPANLLIDASTGRYVLADFGLALAHDASHTHDSPVAGTARYMAPEQAAGLAVDGRADLYALAVTMYVAASGRAPSHDIMQLTPPLSEVSALPLDLARAIDRCRAQHPDERFRDAEQFLSAIEPAPQDEPLPLALHTVREHASASRTLLFWSAVIAVTTILAVAGETSGSLGRAILIPVGQSVVMLFLTAAAFRGAEAIVDARQQLRRGHRAGDIARALTGESGGDGVVGIARSAKGGLVQVGVALALSYGQNFIGDLPLPDVLSELAEVGALFLPPMLLARGARTLVSASGLARRLREAVAAPLARGITRVLTRFTTRRRDPNERVEVFADQPTELRLVHAVSTGLAALPPAQRAQLGVANDAAGALAQQVIALRAHVTTLDAYEADAMRLADSVGRAAALETVRVDRAVTQQRLQTAMMALESLRLDVLRARESPSLSGLSDALAQLRDVQRQVDAMSDVRRLLATPTPT
ncbi:MAG: serine/threonine protein kinase [Gemmatimonadaceae bacterium]|nr:serine/threonine protein kinase [Gemmatimonadaceae bacterium]